MKTYTGRLDGTPQFTLVVQIFCNKHTGFEEWGVFVPLLQSVVEIPVL
jgi:hypothetical protein